MLIFDTISGNNFTKTLDENIYTLKMKKNNQSKVVVIETYLF